MPNISVASTSEILAVVGQTSAGLWIFVALLIGIPLAFYVVEAIINSMRGSARGASDYQENED